MGIVSEKFQVVIPPGVRKAAGIKPGQRVRVTAVGGVVQITPEKPRTANPSRVEKSFGMIKAKIHADIEDMDGGKVLARLKGKS